MQFILKNNILTDFFAFYPIICKNMQYNRELQMDKMKQKRKLLLFYTERNYYLMLIINLIKAY